MKKTVLLTSLLVALVMVLSACNTFAPGKPSGTLLFNTVDGSYSMPIHDNISENVLTQLMDSGIPFVSPDGKQMITVNYTFDLNTNEPAKMYLHVYDGSTTAYKTIPVPVEVWGKIGGWYEARISWRAGKVFMYLTNDFIQGGDPSKPRIGETAVFEVNLKNQTFKSDGVIKYDEGNPNDGFVISDSQVDPTGLRFIKTIYHVNSDFTNGWDYFVFDAIDGSKSKLLLEGTEPGLPSWSPDGKKLVYLDFREDQQICVMEKNLITSVTYNAGCETFTDPHRDTDVVFSPDGKRLTFWAFTQSGNNGKVTSYIEVFKAGDGKPELITKYSNTGFDGSPIWSPDSQFMAFYAAIDGVPGYYTLNKNGGNLKLIYTSKDTWVLTGDYDINNLAYAAFPGWMIGWMPETK